MVGCVCFLIQYNADPKYYTFTYAFIQDENWVMWSIFGAHEFIFMFHAWSMMTSSNCLFTFQAIALSNLIDGMSGAINNLASQQLLLIKHDSSKTKSLGLNLTKNRSETLNVGVAKLSPIATIRRYEKMEDIIFDYKQLMLINDLYNSWVSYKLVFLHVCGYCQFISDVFLAVQVLRLPQTGILDIWYATNKFFSENSMLYWLDWKPLNDFHFSLHFFRFYIEDSLVSMYMIYRVYNIMSRVEPASQQFFRVLRNYVISYKSSTIKRQLLHKTVKTLKVVSLKIGPCPVERSTVLSAMEILGNYYICVALW